MALAVRTRGVTPAPLRTGLGRSWWASVTAQGTAYKWVSFSLVWATCSRTEPLSDHTLHREHPYSPVTTQNQATTQAPDLP